MAYKCRLNSPLVLFAEKFDVEKLFVNCTINVDFEVLLREQYNTMPSIGEMLSVASILYMRYGES